MTSIHNEPAERHPEGGSDSRRGSAIRGEWLRISSRYEAKAFSLIEVVMAIGITAFAAFAIAGLIPAGMSSFRQTKNLSTAAEISRQVFSQVQVTPFTDITSSAVVTGGSNWRLPPPAGSVSGASGATSYVRYFSDEGVELASTATPGSGGNSAIPVGTIYEVNVGVRYAPFVQQSNNGTSLGTNNCLVIITVQVAYNPGLQALDMSQTNSSLWAGTANGGTTPIQIYTYQTMLAGDPSPNT